MPYVTWTLIAVNIVVFIGYYGMFSNERALAEFFRDWGLVPAMARPGAYITSMFLHAGIMHLAGNMLFLWVFGDNIEDQLGHVVFFIFYVLGGVGAAFAQSMSDPNSLVPMVGASGAIAAVMGAYLLLFPKARIDILIFLVVFVRIIPVRAWIVLGLWFAVQMVQGWTTPSDQGGVAHWAHAGGFLAGVLMILPFWLYLGGPDFWRRTEGHPPNPDASYRFVRTSVPQVRR